jgi:AAA domain
MSYKRNIRLPAPYLRRVWLDPSGIADRSAYPFCLPFLQDDFELSFDRSITIIVGENGTGKSTFLEGIAVLAGYDEAGGGKGYRPVDHSRALEKMGGQLSSALRASWLPKITNGWFFRAESFFCEIPGRGQPRRYSRRSPRHPARLPLAFPRRGFFALLRRALPEARHLHLRRTGIRAVAVTPDRVSKADATDGSFRQLPDHPGHPFACPDGLSRRAPAAVDQVRAGAGDREGDGPLQGHAGILRRSGGVRGSGVG